MPRYVVVVGDESTHVGPGTDHPYRWDEEIVRVETYPEWNNQVYGPEQSGALLEHTRFVIITKYNSPIYIDTSDRPIQGPMTLMEANEFNSSLTVRKMASSYYSNPVGSGVRSSPNGPKKVKKSLAIKRTTSNRCPPGFRYDFKRRTCVKIKGRKKYATKKMFRNNKRR